MSRINLGMPIEDCLVELCDGNPGALNVLIQLVQTDPLGTFDLMILDGMGIYGADIWIAYKDGGGEDLAAFRAAIRTGEVKQRLETATVQKTVNRG